MVINETRMRRRMEAVNAIAVTDEGGMMRLALTGPDLAARELLQAWMREEGMMVTVDDMGNMYGMLPGAEAGSLPILSGSHMDTQPNGGRYDGFYGVMAALEAVCSIRDAGIVTRSPLVVVNWTNEEGSRFKPPMIASGVVAGRFDAEWAHGVLDGDGITLCEALASGGYLGEKENRITRAKALIEAHIEQGPVLFDEGFRLGVVDAVLGMAGFTVTLRGRADHAGPAPMAGRSDAFMMAALAMTRYRKWVLEYGAPAVATVGTIKVEPSSPNVIPGLCRFTVDVRCRSMADLRAMEAALERMVHEAAREMRGEAELSLYWLAEPVAFDLGVTAALERAAAASGLPYRRITSGAGHDAVYMSAIMPTGMLFIPSIDGRSHCPEEQSRIEDMAAGAAVLADAILEVDREG